eukprot:CAMPEP_0201561914 /NCGR_PEP_ID=MMETSP0173_2-20130828/79045_1 /ASSEMBLY_ACC=CAM_ASM_000268 /TAXON_ID=218659 /ORGANISM="Vexillifera sp., Strain DIVA3 564/2" /LENGTH=446 /DNA_ID=CAMNT_0047976441 /DNA_START=1205 /DNA_END=2542 /DNA_ORIENTATION=-
MLARYDPSAQEDAPCKLVFCSQIRANQQSLNTIAFQTHCDAVHQDHVWTGSEDGALRLWSEKPASATNIIQESSMDGVFSVLDDRMSRDTGPKKWPNAHVYIQNGYLSWYDESDPADTTLIATISIAENLEYVECIPPLENKALISRAQSNPVIQRRGKLGKKTKHDVEQQLVIYLKQNKSIALLSSGQEESANLIQNWFQLLQEFCSFIAFSQSNGVPSVDTNAYIDFFSERNLGTAITAMTTIDNQTWTCGSDLLLREWVLTPKNMSLAQRRSIPLDVSQISSSRFHRCFAMQSVAFQRGDGKTEQWLAVGNRIVVVSSNSSEPTQRFVDTDQPHNDQVTALEMVCFVTTSHHRELWSLSIGGQIHVHCARTKNKIGSLLIKRGSSRESFVQLKQVNPHEVWVASTIGNVYRVLTKTKKLRDAMQSNVHSGPITSIATIANKVW